MSACCEPGCSAEVLCPVHQALDDLRAKVLRLPDARRHRARSGPDYGKWYGDGSIWRMDVLALFDKEKP